MAALDKKVLLIDLNMYAPVLASQFGVNTEHTLNDTLEGQCDIHECIHITNFPNLEILTAGSLSKGMNTLLLSRQTSSVFEKLRKHYDLIIIDTPEAGTYIDAVPMMKMSDMTFFVVRAEKSSKNALEEAEQLTSDFGINNLFLVLNDAKSGVNHSGSKTAKLIRLGQDEKTGQKSSPVHDVFRKIALWFY
jgi:capsular exopolysaccharide synthesis family protein